MDRVIGVDRLPIYNDRGSLPYLDCILKEVLRWAVFQLPHCQMFIAHCPILPLVQVEPPCPPWHAPSCNGRQFLSGILYSKGNYCPSQYFVGTFLSQECTKMNHSNHIVLFSMTVRIRRNLTQSDIRKTVIIRTHVKWSSDLVAGENIVHSRSLSLSWPLEFAPEGILPSLAFG